MSQAEPPSYLKPYLSAAAKFGGGFGTLLWASPKTQSLRFDALLKAFDVTGCVVTDVGCGRADLLQHMLRKQIYPRHYTGLEAVNELAIEAEKKQLPNCRIIRGDFVTDPTLLDNGSDVLLFSGSLNTLPVETFHTVLKTAVDAAKRAVVFNFLSSSLLAGATYLTWHPPLKVHAFATTIGRRVGYAENYLKGDATVCIFKD